VSVAISLQCRVRAARSAATDGRGASRRNQAGNLPNDERDGRTGSRCVGKLRPDNANSASACNPNGNLIYISKVEIFLRDLPRIPPGGMLAEVPPELVWSARMSGSNLDT
jgi:hypothetical protein